jgi:hypothetical protein
METAHFLTFQTFQVMQLRQTVAAVVPAALEARAVVARAPARHCTLTSNELRILTIPLHLCVL